MDFTLLVQAIVSSKGVRCNQTSEPYEFAAGDTGLLHWKKSGSDDSSWLPVILWHNDQSNTPVLVQMEDIKVVGVRVTEHDKSKFDLK